MLNGPSGLSPCHECQAPRNAARSRRARTAVRCFIIATKTLRSFFTETPFAPSSPKPPSPERHGERGQTARAPPLPALPHQVPLAEPARQARARGAREVARLKSALLDSESNEQLLYIPASYA
jgi:hypothetical protein